ncbi:MAG: YaiO family outer membrane beta-barrel protein [Alphaproteobacteria bacterium]|nr:MAG: YaiO family outer membrane beta-barrel protein [Alphaproteobacteria bacterium]
MKFIIMIYIALFWFASMAQADDYDPVWQTDAGFEFSDFSRRNQPNWNQEFTQVTRFFDSKKMAMHGKIIRYDQFSNIDSEYEAGVDRSFFPWLNAYLYGSMAPDADFRPEWRLMGGGSLRLNDPAWNLVPVWLTLDSRYEDYSDTEVMNINPGLRIEPADRWSIAGRMISVKQRNEERVYGFDLRLDGAVADDWRFYTGYANAPETVAGVTVDTTTYFAGAAIDITQAHTLRLGYTHDDRENSYIRQVLNVSLTYRF